MPLFSVSTRRARMRWRDAVSIIKDDREHRSRAKPISCAEEVSWESSREIALLSARIEFVFLEKVSKDNWVAAVAACDASCNCSRVLPRPSLNATPTPLHREVRPPGAEHHRSCLKLPKPVLDSWYYPSTSPSKRSPEYLLAPKHMRHYSVFLTQP
jgi:hypothetical protein